MSKGFLIYAHNNEEIDYGKIALVCALMLKSHLKENQTCLVTDQGTVDWLRSSNGDELIDYAFNHIKILPYSVATKGSVVRKFLDTKSTVKELLWHNGTRASAYDLTPFDETIILDSDVLVQDNTFDLVWGNDEDVMINKKAITLEHKAPSDHEVRLDKMGIPMYWATMVYFQKTERAKLLFDLVAHIKEKYDYYQFVYEFPGKLFRNDYAFSIAVHMLNGFLENDEFKSFPVDTILSSFDIDELFEVRKDELLFLVNSPTEHWKFTINNVKKLNVHCMNKYSLLRQADKLIDLYYTDHAKPRI